jgi:nucleoside-diphosphate-sugar epimerase
MVHELADRGEQPVVIDDFSSGFDGRGYSVLQVIEAMRQESGNDFPVEFVVRRPGDPAEIVASAERMRNLLGWRPQWDDLSLSAMRSLGNANYWRKATQGFPPECFSCPTPSHCWQGETG